MKFCSIAYYSILRIFRDRKSLASMLLLPIILVLILGNALSGMFTPQSLGKTAVCYLDNDKSYIASNFKAFLENESIREMLKAQEVASFEEGQKLVAAGKVSAMIVLEKNLSNTLQTGGSADLKVYRNSSSKLRGMVVENIIDSFVNGANTIMASAKLGMKPSSFEHSPVIENTPISAAGTMPGAMDYYAVAMLVMAIMYGMLYGIHGIGEDFLENMSIRLRSAPVGIGTQLLGKSAGIILSVFLQSIVLIAFTGVVYKANWGSNIPFVLFVSFSLTVFSVVTGIMLCMLVRDRMAASGIANTIIPVSTFLSGGYARIISDNALFNSFRYILPNHLGHTAIFNTIYGGPVWQTQLCMGILWCMTAVMLAAAIIAGRRRMN